jgi:hypothetical protein
MVGTAHGELAVSVRRHLQALGTSSELTTIYRRMYEPMAAQVTPEDVIQALHRAGVRCVLMGTHGIGGWRSQARATQDVDVLVTKKDVRKAARVLQETFADLRVQDTVAVTRFLDPTTEKPVIDLMKPNQPVFQMVFRHTIPVGETHRIPDLEMAVVCKFAAMVSPNREQSRKFLDAADFVDVLKHNRASINLVKLRQLGEKMYAGGGAEIMKLVEDVFAGRKIEF